jgi:hypothetical protein
MKKSIFLLLIIYSFSGTAAELAVRKPITKFEQQPTADALPPVKAEPVPTGPSGFGPFRIGMRKDEVEVIKDGAVALISPLVLIDFSKMPERKPPEGEDVFKSNLKTPYSDNFLRSEFRFKHGILTSVNVAFEHNENTRDYLKSQIQEKYGPPVEKNERQEEQCLFKNGTNFKITPGVIRNTWTTNGGPGTIFVTTITDLLLESCPSRLDVPKSSPSKYLWVRVQRIDGEVVIINNVF